MNANIKRLIFFIDNKYSRLLVVVFLSIFFVSFAIKRNRFRYRNDDFLLICSISLLRRNNLNNDNVDRDDNKINDINRFFV